MRQSRNQARLEQIGIPLDNNIPDLPSITQQKVLLTAGTLPEAVDGIVGLTGNYTIPAWSVTQNCDNVALSPNPIAYYDSTQDDLLSAGGTAAGNTSAILNNNSPIVSTNVPIGPGTSLNAGNILPPNLNTAYTSSTLLPATFNDQQAIDSVIECNCDCWVQ
jgi:hypothetical protein